jgi:gliding motility-associated lipoprotein GldD
MRIQSKILLLLCLAILFNSCEKTVYPKPKAYPKIDFPTKDYVIGGFLDCGIKFKIPTYAIAEKDLTRNAEPCWFNIDYKTLNAKLHLSYKEITNPETFFEYQDDAWNFAFKHSSKADDIIPYFKTTPKGNFSVLYEIEGNTASQLQFYVTDSVKHYLRGALYFNAPPNKDSLAPVLQFIRTDIDTFISTIDWKN